MLNLEVKKMCSSRDLKVAFLIIKAVLLCMSCMCRSLLATKEGTEKSRFCRMCI